MPVGNPCRIDLRSKGSVMRSLLALMIGAALVSGCNRPIMPMIAGLVPAPTQEGAPIKLQPVKIFNYTW